VICRSRLHRDNGKERCHQRDSRNEQQQAGPQRPCAAGRTFSNGRKQRNLPLHQNPCESLPPPREI